MLARTDKNERGACLPSHSPPVAFTLRLPVIDLPSVRARTCVLFETTQYTVNDRKGQTTKERSRDGDFERIRIAGRSWFLYE